MSIAQNREVLDCCDKVQLTALTITDVEVVSDPWNDGGIATGVYYMWSTVDLHFLLRSTVGGAAVTDLTGVILLAYNPISVVIPKGTYIHAVAATGKSGALKFLQLDRG